jgi:uncharacterized protein (TIGR03067 family)
VTWGEFVDPLGGCGFVEAAGRLIVTVPGDRTRNLNPMAGYNLDAPRFLRDVEGDFEARVTVLPHALPQSPVSTSPSLPYVGAGLIVWQDETHFLRLFRAWQPTSNVVVDPEWYAGNVSGPRPHMGASVTDQPTHLRVRRSGNSFYLAASPDGQTWTDVTTATDLPLAARVRVGVAVVNSINQDFTAWFEGLSVEQSPNQAPPAAAQADHEQIQGTWTGVSADMHGQKLPDVVVKAIGPTVTFVDGKVKWNANPSSEAKELLGPVLGNFNLEGIFHLDPTKSPKTIDLTVLGQNPKTPLGTPAPRVLLGIYRLDGDSLEICIAIDPDHTAERPTKFESVPGKFISHMKLRRQAASSPEVPGLVRLRSLTPGKDQLPLPHRGSAKAVTVVGDAWRIENTTNEGNFNVMVVQALDGLPKDGVLVFRAKVKVDAKDKAMWGDLGFGTANEVYRSWDQWPGVRSRYDGNDSDWTEKEVRYPAADVKTDPPTVYLYAGLHANGVLWLKDVELLHLPATSPPVPPVSKAPPTNFGPGVVQRIMKSAVPIHTNAALGRVNGSGWVGATYGNEAYILTTSQAVGMKEPAMPAPERIEIVLEAGTPQERWIEGKLLALSREDDLAVVRIKGVNLPGALPIVPSHDLQAGQKLAIVGFPSTLPRLDMSVTPKVRSTTVAGRVSGRSGTINLIQLEGGAESGNSGSVVVDMSGSVKALIVAIGPSSTSLSWAIPGEYVVNLMHGRVLEPIAGQATISGDWVKQPFRANVADPLNWLTRVTADLWVGQPGKVRPAPAAGEPTPAPGDSPRVTVPLVYDPKEAVPLGGSHPAQAEATLPRLKVGEVYWFQPHYYGKDGKDRWGEAVALDPGPDPR